MGLLIKRFRSTKALLNFLDDRAADEPTSWVFRGHSNSEHRLKTSLERYWSIVHEEWDSTVDRMLERFRDGVIRLGLQRPSTENRLTWMEIARHHGAPSPLIDFSWSPYVALFFAFNRTRDRPDKNGGHSVIYALNINLLGKHWARENANDSQGQQFSTCYREFCDPNKELFATNLPENTVRFVPWPGEYSHRMQRQMGAFLYCTLDYGCRKVDDLEGYLKSLNDSFDSPVLPNTNDPTLIKVLIPHSMSKEVFKRLEIVNINGASLFGTEDGIADDIWNAYNYNPRLYLRNEGRIGG